MAALMRANCEAFELSVGKDTWMPGLLTACPAATLAFKDYETGSECSHENLNKLLTWMKEFLSGGHEQGILMGTPCAFGIPSQSPVPVGFSPAANPN